MRTTSIELARTLVQESLRHVSAATTTVSGAAQRARMGESMSAASYLDAAGRNLSVAGDFVANARAAAEDSGALTGTMSRWVGMDAMRASTALADAGASVDSLRGALILMPHAAPEQATLRALNDARDALQLLGQRIAE
jgi:hypothetical protein